MNAKDFMRLIGYYEMKYPGVQFLFSTTAPNEYSSQVRMSLLACAESDGSESIIAVLSPNTNPDSVFKLPPPVNDLPPARSVHINTLPKDL